MAYGKSIGSGFFAPGFRLISGNELGRAFTKMFQGNIARQDGITAKAAGNKATAVPLSQSFNRIAVCATLHDSALMPPAIAGSMVAVVNSGAAGADIFGAGTDTINGSATATAYTLATGKTAIFICITKGAWFANLSA